MMKILRSNRPLQILFLTLIISFITACAHQPQTSTYNPPGFFFGLWHGAVAPLAFIGSMFSDIRIYAFPNSGVWYDLGFLIGLSCWGGFIERRERIIYVNNYGGIENEIEEIELALDDDDIESAQDALETLKNRFNL